MVEIRTTTPFIVHSQDGEHPFALFTYMTGAGDNDRPRWTTIRTGRWLGRSGLRAHRAAAAVSVALRVLHRSDVSVHDADGRRAQKVNGAFADVTLDCLGTDSRGRWQPVGTAGDYEIAYVKLVDHWNRQGGCNNGVHVMDSTQQFGVWVWGWGSDDTSTGWVSYGYPAGEAVLPINDVVIQ